MKDEEVKKPKKVETKQPIIKPKEMPAPPKTTKSLPLEPGTVEIDPSLVYFTFSRVRPMFSCGRPIQETLDSLLSGALSTSDLPQITLLYDGKNYFSLNNRRLYVFKTLKQAGLIKNIRARVKPVP